MTLTDILRGSGRRRRTPEQWTALEASLSKAQQAALVPGAVRNVCPAREHGDFWVYTAIPQPCPWCLIAAEHEQTLQARRETGQLEIEVGLLEEHLKTERALYRRLEQQAMNSWALEVNEDPLSDPAPMDIAGSIFARAADALASFPALTDAELGPRVVADTPPAAEPTPIVDLTAPTLSVDVADLRRAAGLADTAVIPVVALPPDLEPAVMLPPRPWPAFHVRSDLPPRWTRRNAVRPLAEALAATADLKDQAPATAVLPICRTVAAVQFAKTGRAS